MCEFYGIEGTMKEIQLLLKCLIEETNVTPSQLARWTRMSYTTVWRIVNGRSEGSVASLNKLLNIFGCQLTVRRIPDRQEDIDPNTGKYRRPFDDPIVGNPRPAKIRALRMKTKRP